MDGDKPVCFFRDIEKFMDPDAKWQWIELIPDSAIGKVDEPHESGFISIKLSVHDKTANGEINFETFNACKETTTKEKQCIQGESFRISMQRLAISRFRWIFRSILVNLGLQ